jgi:hypothetical protein
MRRSQTTKKITTTSQVDPPDVGGVTVGGVEV